MDKSDEQKTKESMEWSTVHNNKRRISTSNEAIANKKSPSMVNHQTANINDASSSRKQPQIIPNRYFQEDNKGPFVIWIQPIGSPDNSVYKRDTRLSPFKIGKLICKKYNNINYICSKSRSRVQVNFKNSQEANKLIDDPTMKENDLKAFIPSFRVMRRGIIKGIDEDISEEEIVQEVESEYKVLNARRLNKRNRDPNRHDDDPRWIASKSLVLTFSGQNLPGEIFLHKIKIEVEPYLILPITCYNCFKIGHSSTACRGETKCNMCGETKHQGSCSTTTPKCANCKGEHISTDKSCPMYAKEYEIKRLMAYENIAMGDARKLVYGNGKKNIRSSKEDFPALQSKPFTPFNEVVKAQKNHRLPAKKQEIIKPHANVSNERYHSGNGVALRKASDFLEEGQSGDRRESRENITPAKEPRMQENQQPSSNRPVLKDTFNDRKQRQIEEKIGIKLKNSLQQQSNTVRTYSKTIKDINKSI